MPLDVETRLSRVESSVDGLGARLERAEKRLESMSDEQHGFYMRDWPPVQTALQNVTSLRGDVTGLREEMQRLQVSLITGQSNLATLPQQLHALSAAFREMETKNNAEIQSIKKFVWMLTGGLVLTSFVAQLVVRLIH